METLNASDARSKFFKIVQDVIVKHEPLCITSKHGNVVVMSQEEYENMHEDLASVQETMYILSVPSMKESIVEASSSDISEYTNHKVLDW